MNSYKSQPSFSFSHNRYMTHRQVLALSYVFFSFTDIITTYFGMVNFHLVETIPWTTAIINNWGWDGVILRAIITSVLVLYLFRFQPDSVFKVVKYPAWIILGVYAIFTTFNNLFLMFW